MKSAQHEHRSRTVWLVVLVVIAFVNVGGLLWYRATFLVTTAPLNTETTSAGAGPLVAPRDTADANGAPDRSADSAQSPATAGPGLDKADITFALGIPSEWDDEVQCIVSVTSTTGESTVLRPQGIRADVGREVRVNVPPEGARVRISGPDINTMVGELRWDGESTLRFLSRSEIHKAALDRGDPEFKVSGFDPGGPVPALAFSGEPVAKGGQCAIELVPLVSVTLLCDDKNGSPFAPPVVRCDFVWSVPLSRGSTGMSCEPEALTDPFGKQALWRVPVSAKLFVKPSLPGVSFEPRSYRAEVPAREPKIVVRFSVPDKGLVRVRVVSAAGQELPDAQFRGCRAVRVPAPSADSSPGTFTLLVSGQEDLEVWAPNHLVRSLSAGGLPADWVTEIVLNTADSALIVIVETETGDFDPRWPITVQVVTQAFSTGQDSWRYSAVLPQDGRLEIRAAGSPYVKPVSEFYDFELTDTSEEAGVPGRRFLARKRTGIVVTVAASNESAADSAGYGASVVISAAMPDDASPQHTPSGSTFITLKYGKGRFIPVERGDWVIRAWTNQPVAQYGQANVSVHVDILEVRIELRERPTAWGVLKIVDFTGFCQSSGTAFLLGMATLTNITDAQEIARSYAAMHVTENPPAGQLALEPVTCAAAHADGAVVLPRWLDGRVLVVPADGNGLFEGSIDWSDQTVTVRRPSWGVTATFSADPNSSAEARTVLSEPGWFIAIREYKDLQDLRRLEGGDFKIPSTLGAGEMRSLAPGSYVAYYIRAGEEERFDPEREEIVRQVKLEWFDPVRFEAQSGAVHVPLPVTRK